MTRDDLVGYAWAAALTLALALIGFAAIVGGA